MYKRQVNVVGTIQEQTQSSVLDTSSGYQHNTTMDYIDNLMDDSDNKGILLYVDSPGGAVYELSLIHILQGIRFRYQFGYNVQAVEVLPMMQFISEAKTMKKRLRWLWEW